MAHHNPLLCSMRMEALMLMYRWEIMGEPFPDVAKPQSWMKTRLIRQASNTTKESSYDASYARYHLLVAKNTSGSRVLTVCLLCADGVLTVCLLCDDCVLTVWLCADCVLTVC
jgi:hypothetical protein